MTLKTTLVIWQIIFLTIGIIQVYRHRRSDILTKAFLPWILTSFVIGIIAVILPAPGIEE